jgi:hypothetical protein
MDVSASAMATPRARMRRRRGRAAFGGMACEVPLRGRSAFLHRPSHSQSSPMRVAMIAF